ncbi:MAG: glucokinase [Weeksellaceae bacterium]|nr:glucokinase [Weeksellaceae bacterium]
MGASANFPLYLPGVKSSSNQNITIISADVRETETILALFKTEGGKAVNTVEKIYPTTDFESFSDIVNRFKEEHSLNGIKRLAVGVPGPVISGQGISSRLPWILDAQEIAAKTGIENIYLINDLEATAYGLADLSEDCLMQIYKSDTLTTGNVAILAPGSGLGEAGLFFDGKYLRPFATEGGHSEFSPRTNVEVEFYQFLNKIYGIVSWENVLSKNGLFNIFRFLRDEKRHPQSEKLIERLREEKDFSTVIYESAIEDNEQISTIALNTYLEFLAREANSLVLKLKATGGLLIGGELPILLKDYIDKERLYQKFMISDKMERVLKDIPIYMILSEKMILTGAAYYAAFSEE